MSSRNHQFPLVMESRRRKPRKTPWAQYNPDWIKDTRRKPSFKITPKTSKGE